MAKLDNLSEECVRTSRVFREACKLRETSTSTDQLTFGFQEVTVLRTAARLISEGLSASKVERALAGLRRQLGPDRSLSAMQAARRERQPGRE